MDAPPTTSMNRLPARLEAWFHTCSEVRIAGSIRSKGANTEKRAEDSAVIMSVQSAASSVEPSLPVASGVTVLGVLVFSAVPVTSI